MAEHPSPRDPRGLSKLEVKKLQAEIVTVEFKIAEIEDKLSDPNLKKLENKKLKLKLAQLEVEKAEIEENLMHIETAEPGSKQ